ncbi:beta-1,6-N-acetylglucosaminyltransferase [Parapedobacter deserti]|uniref:Peptide O-xylosyltransferase n=1 Tax=Parapedobacter deserti TaxID=1912957 RepID=A0ABV7JDM0_9SPHI
MAAIAHLILAHECPRQLARLINAVTHPTADIFVHIDKNSPIDPFLKALHHHTNLRFIKNRKKIVWGAFSMVEATLQSFKEILSTSHRFSFINLISAADYPLKAAGSIYEILQKHEGNSFMEMHFDDSPWWMEAQQKITKYHFTDYAFPGKYLIEKVVNQITPIRKIPNQMVFTGRSQWMTLSLNHVKYILSFADNNPQVIRFFKHTWGPDEFIFQTILYNSPFREELVNDNLRYIDWSEQRASPKTLTIADYYKLANSGKLFARKFNPDVDSEILDLIDSCLLERS